MSILAIVRVALLQLYLYLFLLSTLDGHNTSQHDYKKHKNYPLLNYEECCGTSFTNRIIGGQNASLGQYPWLVFIDSPFGFCGGVLISRLYVLTAAHCMREWSIRGRSPPRLYLVGEYHLNTRRDCQQGVCAPPAQVAYPESELTHPGWEPYKVFGLGPYDIALVRLKEKVTFNDYVKPICLPFEPEDHIDLANKSAEVAGWGAVSLKPLRRSLIPQTLKVKMFQQDRCDGVFKALLNSSLKDVDIEGVVEPTVVCGGGVIGQDSCTGDSGGPLMRARVVDGRPAYALVGLVSFGVTKCASSETPGIYTDVRLFLDWILDNIKP